MDRGNTIGARIEELRAGKKLTQAQLAKEMSVRRETVVQWESNTRDLKTAATVKLADFFEVSCDYILRGVSAENAPVYRELGLTDKAIATLHEVRQYGKGYVVNDIMNEVVNDVLSHIYPTLRRIADYHIEVTLGIYGSIHH